ncbi:MAG: 50S ribosomal protein L3 [Acidobacteriia bacterium]|jgi:large subunit ribosomal protein L3|nr:50S ribosomal protein L3 [Terriglobia bacterium]
MINGIIAKKVGMTQIFRSDGVVVPVTVLKAGPCVVVQRKTTAKEGYDAVQLGLVEFLNPKKVTKPMAGHFKKHGDVAPVRLLREVRLEGKSDEVKVGDKVLVDQFKPADKVDVVGTSKGRGFAGFVKRHHFRGGAATHGSMFHRAPGSIGASAFPSRVLKGMKGAGHMGVERVTVKNLQVVQVDVENHLLLVKGAVPGHEGAVVIVRKSLRQ